MLGSAVSAALVVVSWFAQAEPAPAEDPPAFADPAPTPVADPVTETPRQYRDAVAVHGRLATRPTGADDAYSRQGFSLGGTFAHRYAAVADVFSFGVGLDFFFDHFSGGGTQNSFVALQTVTFERLAVRPWLGAGGGLGVAGSARGVARGAIGIELPFSRANAIAVRADLTHALSSAAAFGDLFDVGLGLLQRF